MTEGKFSRDLSLFEVAWCAPFCLCFQLLFYRSSGRRRRVFVVVVAVDVVVVVVLVFRHAPHAIQRNRSDLLQRNYKITVVNSMPAAVRMQYFPF